MATSADTAQPPPPPTTLTPAAQPPRPPPWRPMRVRAGRRNQPPSPPRPQRRARAPCRRHRPPSIARLAEARSRRAPLSWRVRAAASAAVSPSARNARRRPRRPLRRGLPPQAFRPALPQHVSRCRCPHAVAVTQQATARVERRRWRPLHRPWPPRRGRTSHRRRRSSPPRRSRRHVFGLPRFPWRRNRVERHTLSPLRRRCRLPPRRGFPPPTARRPRPCVLTRRERARAPKRSGGRRLPSEPLPPADAFQVLARPFRSAPPRLPRPPGATLPP